MTEPSAPRIAVLTERQLRDIVTEAKGSHSMTVTAPPKAAPATPGWQTTEFWVTILTAVGATAAAATNNLPPRYATLASTIAVVAYAISRGLAKR
jgi:hypothetical protein